MLSQYPSFETSVVLKKTPLTDEGSSSLSCSNHIQQDSDMFVFMSENILQLVCDQDLQL